MPASVPHRRGGKHRVKDADRTNTIYDEFTYKDLLLACKARKIYRKDDTKSEMMRKLAAQDRIEATEAARMAAKVSEARERERETKERILREKEARRAARRLEREREGDDGEASDSSMSEGEMEDYHRTLCTEAAHDDIPGDVLSELSFSTSSDSSAPETPRAISPSTRLRLFELPCNSPSTPPSPSLSTDMDSIDFDFDPKGECHPHPVPYIPLRLTTQHSHEKLALPGSKYPPHIAPETAPLLSPFTQSAARNGHLTGLLANARIESAADWGRRTDVDGKTGALSFNLPPPQIPLPLPGARQRTLADIYTDLHAETSRLRRAHVSARATYASVRLERTARRALRRKIKMRARAEAYEVSTYRPAMLYVPACLDGAGAGGQRATWVETESEKTLERLFFVRFDTCAVPHYAFWVRDGEWDDPRVANPGFALGKGDSGVGWESESEESGLEGECSDGVNGGRSACEYETGDFDATASSGASVVVRGTVSSREKCERWLGCIDATIPGDGGLGP